MSPAQSLAQKVKELVERVSGCPYEIVTADERLRWCLSHPPAIDESQVKSPCYSFPDLSADNNSIELELLGPDMRHISEDSYGIRISYKEFYKLLNPDVRKKLEKIIPAVVKDYEIMCDGIEGATKKYGLPQGELRVTEASSMRFGAKFDTGNMNDDEILKKIEPMFRAINEVWRKFDCWIGYAGKYSPGREVLLKRGVYVPRLPGRLRRDGFLVIDWPPNTGNSVADMEIADDVRKYLENDWAVVFTPEGRLKLVNGKIMLGKPKTKQEKRKR